jgi:VanZ family protein
LNTHAQRLANPWWFAVAAWLGLIAFSSTSAAGESSERAFSSLSAILLRYFHVSDRVYWLFHFIADKGVHVTLFAVLAILLWQAIPQGRGKSVVILLAGGLVGSGSELLQRFFPDRDPAIRDVIINLGGTAFGLMLCWAVSRWQSRHTAREMTSTAEVCDRFVR